LHLRGSGGILGSWKGICIQGILKFSFHFSGYAISGDQGLYKVALRESPIVSGFARLFFSPREGNGETWLGHDVDVKGESTRIFWRRSLRT
jgi:hypothetical protein